MDGIFISYRREDSSGYAGRLYDRLSAHFGADRVFMDVEGIDPGTDFVDAIERAVLSCKVLIVLIGNDWISITDEQGRRRLDDQHDFIRIETGTALDRDIRVVPVLLDGAPMPRADELPTDLAALCRRQAIEIRHKQWEATTRNLIDTLEKIYHPDSPGFAAADQVRGAAAGEGVNPETEPGTMRRGIWVAAGVAGLVLAAMGVWLVLHTAPPLPSASVANPDAPVALRAASAPEPRASLVIEPGNIDFGRVAVGSSGSMRLTLQNTGDGDAVFAAPSLGGQKAGDIRVHNNCPDRLPASGKCAIELEFAPGTSGPVAASLKIGQVDGEQQVVALSGTAVQQPKVVIAAAEPVGGAGIGGVTTSAALSRSTVVTSASIAAINKSAMALSVGSGKPKPSSPPVATTISAASASARSLPSPKIRESAGTSVSPQQAQSTALVTADGKLPQAGEQWVYKVRGRWANTPLRTLEVAATGADNAGVTESVALINDKARKPVEQRSVPGPAAYITDSKELGTEFSPYLAAFGQLGEDTVWSDIPTPNSDSFWTGWHSTGEVTGRETVKVPAGEFSALKVEVWSARSGSGSSTENYTEPVRVHYQIWYAPQIKRYVKMVRSVVAKVGQTMDTDTFELVSYRQK